MLKNSFSLHMLLCFSLFSFSFFFMMSSLIMMFYNSLLIIEWKVFNSCGVFFSLPLMFDFINLMFASVVVFISANVMLFSNMYMKGEIFISRFLIIVVLFIVSMLFLLFIPHVISILLGWDGLGLISYTLVIYYQNNKSLGAGMITALMNRVGDALLIISISWLLCQGHWYIFNLWGCLFSDVGCELLLVLSLMFAAMTKSAQIPFSSWLPAAMAAPTPVSALVHSSTLVTAGVYLLIRLHPFLSSFSIYLNVVLIISCLTLFMAGMSALGEFDVKKVVALSTLSQLGVMMFSIGLDFPLLAFFHLITHALFKALLFICVGTLINTHMHCQDLRTMGNLVFQVPSILSCLNVANIALCGLPFLSGFYSKDLIMEVLMHNSYSFFLVMGFMVGVLFTTMYSFRLMYMTTISMSSGFVSQLVEDGVKDSSFAGVLMSLSVVFCGCMLNWFMLSPLKDPFLSFDMKLSPLFFIFFSIILMYLWSCSNFLFKGGLFFLLLNFSYYMWFLVPNSSQMMMKLPLMLSKKSLMVDQGWLEVLGPSGIYSKYLMLQWGVFMMWLLGGDMSFSVYFI